MQTFSSQSQEELLAKAAGQIQQSILSQLHKGYCTVGIVGGRSMPGLLQLMLPHAKLLQNVSFFWLDERVIGEKNYASSEPILEQMRMHGAKISWYPLRMTTQEGIIQEAHAAIGALKALAGEPRFDIVIVSAGEDGHVAGLFPHADTLRSRTPHYVIEHHAPKPPPLRISVSPTLLLQTAQAFLFFVGDKSAAYHAFTLNGPAEDCPARLLKYVAGLTVFTCLS